MNTYEKELFELVNNPEYTFYKLKVNGTFGIDDFIETLDGIVKDEKSFAGIIRLMDMFSPRIMLPKEKFRKIESSDRIDLREFKKNDIRVYVIMQGKTFYVVTGGHKQDQKKDIANFKQDVKDFPKEE